MTGALQPDEAGASRVEARLAKHLSAHDWAAALALWQAESLRNPAFLPPLDLIELLVDRVPVDTLLAIVRAVPVPAGPAGQALRLAKAHALIRLGADAEALILFEDFLAVAPKAGNVAAALLTRAIVLGDHDRIARGLAQVAALPGAEPGWFWAFRQLYLNGRLRIGQVELDLPQSVISPQIMLAFARGNFESSEADALVSDLREGDRLLDLGSGTGFVALSAALTRPGLPLMLVEGNPALHPVLHRHLDLNKVAAEVVPTLISDRDGRLDLVLEGNFAGSSVHHDDASKPRVNLPVTDIRRLQTAFRPTLISMDIEGAEAEVIPALDLAPIRRLVVEFHPHLIGAATMSGLLARILASGLVLTQAPERQVFCFARPD